MTTLAVLAGLRDRYVDRAARAARDAAAALDAAALEVAAARVALEAAMMARHAAAARRLLHPGDERVALYLHRCEHGVAAAERTLDDARRTHAVAEHAAEAARRAWTRAEARRGVMRDLAADERRAAARLAERRAEGDLVLRTGTCA